MNTRLSRLYQYLTNFPYQFTRTGGKHAASTAAGIFSALKATSTNLYLIAAKNKIAGHVMRWDTLLPYLRQRTYNHMNSSNSPSLRGLFVAQSPVTFDTILKILTISQSYGVCGEKRRRATNQVGRRRINHRLDNKNCVKYFTNLFVNLLVKRESIQRQ